MLPLKLRKGLRQRMRAVVDTWYRTGDSQELERAMSIWLSLNHIATKHVNGEPLTDEEKEFMRDIHANCSRFNQEKGLAPPPPLPEELLS